MAEQKMSRRRGAILTVAGHQKLQAAKRESEQFVNFGARYTVEELSILTRLSQKTISKIFNSVPTSSGAQAIPVDKQTLDLCFTTFDLVLERSDYFYPDGIDPDNFGEQDRSKELTSSDRLAPYSHLKVDWGEAPDVTVFYGRVDELVRLTNWVNQDCCKLVGILGMGGIGKTTVVTKLTEQLQPHFQQIVWRSLRNAPPLETLLPELIHIFSHQTDIVAPTVEISTQISHLLDYLRQERCLLVLDNAEAIIPSQNATELQQQEYPGYAELFRRIGESSHQSCLLLTSREKPDVLVSLEGETLPVRTLTISGFNADESEALFDAKGLSASAIDRIQLRNIYSGNPLALSIVATSIHDLFDGEIKIFLDTEVNIFSGIRQLLNQQFDRLAPLEKIVMYWLAVERNWLSLADLHRQLVPASVKSHLLAVVDSLQKRSLIEFSRGKFTQQAVVMEYMTESLIDGVVRELTNRDMPVPERTALPLWVSYPLMAAESPNYIYEIQKRLILAPIARQLQLRFGHKLALVQHIQSIIVSLQVQDLGVLHYGGGNLINLLRYLEVDLTGYNFANLPIRQVNFQGTTLRNVDFSGANFHEAIFTHCFGGILAIAFSPNSQLIAAAEYNGSIYISTVADKRIPLQLKGHTNWVWSVAFSPDGQILASASQDGTVRLWDVATGQLVHVLQADHYPVMSLSFRPTTVNLPSGQGAVLATAHGDGRIRCWNVLTGGMISDEARHSRQAWSVRFSPDGKFLATGSDDCTVKIWDAETGTCLHTLTDHTKSVWSVRFSPDGKLLVTCGGDGTIRIWNVATWTVLEVLTGYRNWFFAIEFSPDSQMLAVANVGNVVKIWNIQTHQQIATLHRHVARVSTLDFSPDGKFLVTSGGDRSIRLWDTTTWQELYCWQGYSNWIESVVFNPLGTRVLTGSQDGVVREWDVQTKQILQTFTGHRLGVWSVNYSPDGRSIVSGSADSTVKLWNAETGELVKTFSAQQGDVWKVQFSPDGTLIAAIGMDNTEVFLWRVTGELVGTLIGHQHVVKSLAFSPVRQASLGANSALIATASFDACWRLWDVQTGKMLGCYAGHTNWIWDITFSPDGQLIASCSADLTVRLWCVATGQLLQTFEGHTQEVVSVKFSPNGQYLVTGSADCTIKIWEIETGKVFQNLTGHIGRILSVGYSPDGQVLVSGSGDSTFKLWDLTTGECTATCQPLRPYVGMNLAGANGLTPATIFSLKGLGALN